jgi:hypothetical protein
MICYTKIVPKMVGVNLANFYDKLPLDVQFLYHINKKIENGILSKSLNYEIELINKCVNKKGLSITELDKYLIKWLVLNLNECWACSLFSYSH